MACCATSRPASTGRRATTAKGGIVVAIQRQLGIPVKLVGLGEGIEDLAAFDPDAFVDALFTQASQDVSIEQGATVEETRAGQAHRRGR
jgi:signal recognition particle GTPase